ncbi:MAG TPA: rhodanese-like domain-containing protein [Chitinophagaceae bacterium]
MKYIIAGLFSLAALAATAQYRYDNDKFTTVYPQDLCSMLRTNPGLVLDVRSKGEYEDTAASAVQNIGHMAAAQNIDVRELAGRWREIETYKDKPVYVYCATSQRSRRAARMLADSGFTRVYNINGGLNFFRSQGFIELCPETALHTNLKYKLVAPLQLARHAIELPYTVVDVRPDSAFRAITTDPRRNALGRLSPAKNIPFSAFATKGASIPKNKPVLLVDETGSESIKAANWLLAHGYSDVTVLYSGLEGYVSELPEKNRHSWIPGAPFRLINAATFDARSKGKHKPIVIDVRSTEEFANTAKEAFRNIGQIKGAVNIPAADLPGQIPTLHPDKNKPVVVYGFASSPEVFGAAHALADAGYKDVSVIMGGLFNLRWRAANMKGYEHLNRWVVNVPPANQ